MRPGFLANLGRRLATAAVVLPLLWAAIFLGPPLLMTGIVAAAITAGLFEYFALLEARGLRPFRTMGFLLMAVLFLETIGFQLTPAPLYPALALLALTTMLLRRGDFATIVPPAAATLLGAVYLGALGGSLAALRTLAPVTEGPWRVVLLLATIMVADTFAYFAGTAFGRHRLAPAISPGKTIEGGLGGLVGGVLTAALVRHLGLPALPWSHTIALGALVTIFGTTGDLVESLLKRWAGVKDSGTLFPGHGGMLDRLDSLIFGAPVLYYYFLLR